MLKCGSRFRFFYAKISLFSEYVYVIGDLCGFTHLPMLTQGNGVSVFN